jgi:hypothetical protein
VIYSLQSLLAVLLLFCSSGILIVQSRRWITGLLALQYLGVFGLVSSSWPIGIAVVKLVAGWMAGAVLLMTYENIPDQKRGSDPASGLSGVFFKGFSSILVGVTIYSLVPISLSWFIFASFQQALGGLWLLGLGLLQLAFSRESIRVIIGLLTILSGFEILYATLEASVLMTGLLAVLTVGVAFVGAYLLMASNLEKTT